MQNTVLAAPLESAPLEPAPLESAPLGSVDAGTMPALRLIPDPAGLFRRDYNRSSFMFPHGLGDHPMFNLPGMVELAGRLPQTDEFVYWSNGSVGVTARWEHGKAEKYSLQDTIRNIATNNSIVILKHTEQDPVVGQLLRDFLGRVVDLSGPGMRDDVIVGEALILIASPNRVTSYHIDAEANFLVQIKGDKTLNVFNPEDRTLITDNELERFHAGDYNGAVYKPERQDDAQTYDLRAGYGVHIPVGAPHWVQNGDNVSIALSINYELRSVHRSSRIYRINRRLRRFGISPVAPGVSWWRDRLKLAMAYGVFGRNAPAPPSHGVWTPTA